MLDREQAKEEADAEAEMLDFNKEAGDDAFRLPTEEYCGIAITRLEQRMKMKPRV
ncbi:hypothetical protein Bca101_042847 [Brassica carinata]